MNRREAEEDERFQRELREKLNPQWREQLQMHYRILGVRGPVRGLDSHKLFYRIKWRKSRLLG